MHVHQDKAGNKPDDEEKTRNNANPAMNYDQ
jgi:hypothetical protein